VQFLKILSAHLDFAFFLPGSCKIVRNLHPKPRLRRAAEGLRQPDSHLRAHARFAIHQIIESLPGDAENPCRRRYGEAQRLKTIMPDDAPGMHWIFHRQDLFFLY
jgi:hypothetical protein